MSFINANSGGSASGSSGGSGETPDAGTITLASGETTSDFTRTAGALRLVLTNAGPAAGGAAATATVNGANLFPGDKLELKAILDASANEFKKLPEVAVITSGATIWWYEER